MKLNNLIVLIATATAIFIMGCEKEAPTSTDVDQSISIRNAGNGNGNPGGSKEKSPCKGKALGPWGEFDGLLHVYGVYPDSPSESAGQDFPCDFKKPKNITSVFLRLARTGNPAPDDTYFITIRHELDGPILARSADVPFADVISEDEIFELGEWVEFPLEADYLMAAGDYFVQLERNGPGNNQTYINWFTDWQNPLPNYAGWVKNSEWGWEMYDPILSDEFLMTLCYR